MSASPPATPGHLKSTILGGQHDQAASGSGKRPHFLSTRSLTPTTSVSYSRVASTVSNHKIINLSINSTTTDAASESASIRSGQVDGLFADEDTKLGTGAEGNAGPSVHVTESPADVDADSDDSDGPPPWVRPASFKGKARADPEPVEPQVEAPVFLKRVGASKSLLQEQLRKGEAQVARSRASRRTTAPPRNYANLGKPPETSLQAITPSDATTLASVELVTSKRKYYILTSAGKPVWSTEDEEDVDVTGQAGVMQAIVSIFADEGDKLRYIEAGSVRIAALLKPPLYFFAVSDWGEPESVLNQHLEYLHLLVLSIISLTQLTRLFERRLNHDLRRSLHGTESFFAGLTERLSWDFGILTGALEVFTCQPNVREEVGKAITPSSEKSKDLLYAIVLAEGRVVSLVRPKKHSVHPSDLHILISTVLSSGSLRTSETWLPVCLPRYNATGFLHAYISFPSPSVGLILVSGNREGFFELREWAEEIIGTLTASEKVWHALTGKEAGYAVGAVGVPGLRHFLYKHRAYVQITAPVWEEDYQEESERQRLVTLYQRCHDLLHGRDPAKFIYLRNDQEAVIGWSTQKYELYMAISPLLSKTAAVSAAHGVVKWAKTEEHRLFLIAAPAF